MTTILVLGGYGGFGARLSRRLAQSGHDVLVAGRHRHKAAAFCAGHARCLPIVADRDGDIDAVLAQYRPALVIDAAGPFQQNGYRVPRVCIASGISYLDLADGRAFVTGISVLDAEARAGNVAVIAGASSVPALSGAVVASLVKDMSRVTAIEMAISASNRATAGRSVANAILSYVGKPIRLWHGRRLMTGFGWQDRQIAPFRLGDGTTLGRRWTALADVPDLDLLLDRVKGRPSVVFRAGTELGFQNFVVWLASWPVRWRWIESLEGISSLLLPLQRVTRSFGTDRSGMVVRAFGFVGKRRVERRWTLIASNGDGPEIPVLATALIAERIVAGKIAPGARDAGGELDLDAFAPAFAALSIRHEVGEFDQPDPLYARVMGDGFARLAPAVAAMHDVLRDGGASGRAVVSPGRNPVARMIAAIMRFPASGDHDLHVAFSETDGVECWTRDFSGRRFSSHLSQDRGTLIERFGPLRFRFELPNAGNGLRMVMRGWSCAGLPLPRVLAPKSDAREWEENGRFHFDVPIAMPFVGTIVHYRGWLDPSV